MKVAIYARYSSENQRDASIAGELERVKREIQKVIEAIVDGVKGSELKDGWRTCRTGRTLC